MITIVFHHLVKTLARIGICQLIKGAAYKSVKEDQHAVLLSGILQRGMDHHAGL